jgi:cytidylate kinase
MGYSIAVDGPAGAGKSTIAKQIAQQLDFIYIDTGAMYRAMGLYFLNENINLEDIVAVEQACRQVEVEITYENKVQQIWLNGENVSGQIRTEEIGRMASACATISVVREKLVDLQRKLAGTRCVIMDGRDIGTVVLPDAQLKIYLTASVEERAKRRYKELTEKGEAVTIESIEENIRNRDHNDMTREISPLKQADDAVVVDSSDMSIDEVVQTIIDMVHVQS